MVEICVVIPTYNERENVARLIPALERVLPENSWILIVDDSSPDGTAEIARELGRRYGNIDVLIRPGKLGLGSAYKDGFSRALEAGASVIVEMDADFSHRPEDLPRLLGAIEEGYDVAVGSRYVQGGKIVNWPLKRRIISKGANAIARHLLGLPVKDCTSGYRAYSAQALEKAGFQRVSSDGYAFQVEMLYRCYSCGLRIKEVPITFVERKRGRSKLGLGEVLGFVRDILRLKCLKIY